MVTNALYQHIQIFGRDNLYIVRPDNDADSEKQECNYELCFLDRTMDECPMCGHPIPEDQKEEEWQRNPLR